MKNIKIIPHTAFVIDIKKNDAAKITGKLNVVNFSPKKFSILDEYAEANAPNHKTDG